MNSFLYRCNKKITVTGYALDAPELGQRDRFRVCQVSDLQSEYFGAEQAELLAAVRGASPDVIVITGDLVDRRHTDIPAALAAARGLVKIAPVVYVNGNHELGLPRETRERLYGELAAAGVSLLFDQVASLTEEQGKVRVLVHPDRIIRSDKDGMIYREAEPLPGKHRVIMRLIGLSENTLLAASYGTNGNSKYETDFPVNDRRHGTDPRQIRRQILKLIRKNRGRVPDVLLVHEPQYQKTYARRGIELVLAGHAHGGQWRLPGGQGLYAPGQGLFPKLTEGLHCCGKTKEIVSRGLGNSTFPLRLNNPPEIVLVDFMKEGQKK